jgi:hydrophobic/amphiphilic exporter-1 (mainly G- bacteria), HAE1 family
VQWLAEISIRRPVFACVLVLSLVVVGVFAFFHLAVDRLPRIDLPVIVVTTTQVGASPEDIETAITDRVERAVNTISGIMTLRSTSTEGLSQVVIEFELEKNADIAAQEVRDKVGQILPDLPRGIDPPLITKVDPDANPILYISLAADRPIRELTEFADKTVRRELESLSGVGDLTIVGGRLRQINLWLDPARLRAYRLTAAEVARAVENQNVQLPGGTMPQGTRALTLRMKGRVDSVREFETLVVASRDGSQVRLVDVAHVEDGMADVKTAANIDGRATVILALRRQSGTNTVAVVDAVRERLRSIRAQLPPGYTIEIVRDESDYVKAAVSAVEEHLVVGAVLASLVVLIFLRSWHSTIVAAISIPTSLVSTFALMYAMGFSLNVLTLLALTLSVGIVIDDAIVVLENVSRLMEEKGLPALQAAVEGTREIGLAVLATTLSLVAVFLPVAFMGGMVGRYMYSFGLTMAFAILVSLFVAYTLVPMLASRLLTVVPDAVRTSREARLFSLLDRGYGRLLRWSMAHRWVIVLACAASLAACVPLFSRIGRDFLPRNDESQFEVTVHAAEGTTVEETELIETRMARAIRTVPGVDYTIALVGNDSTRAANKGSIFVRLTDVRTRRQSQYQIMDRIRAEILPRFASDNLRTSVSQTLGLTGGGTGNKEVAYALGGPELRRLGEYARHIETALKQTPGVVDVDTSLVLGKPEVAVTLDRAKAAELGVQVADVATTLNTMVGGRRISRYFEEGEEYEVHARAVPRWRSTSEGVAQMGVPSTRLGTVSLDNLAVFRDETGPSQIDRLGRRRTVTITANMQSGYSQQVAITAIARAVRELRLAPGYRAVTEGTSAELGKATRSFLTAFLLSVIFMYLVLAAQFESWLHPVTILLALPLTIPFALVAIIAFGQSLNIYTALGILVLFGVVKKNAILQIDHTLKLRAQGRPRLDAILEANRDRLRPILMTTLAFVAGMLPLLFARGTGAGDSHAIGSVIAAGQTLALLLTLVATPVFYSLFDDLQTRFAPRRWAARLSGRRPAPLPAEHPVRTP